MSDNNLVEHCHQFEEDYDAQARESEWFGGDALFGMMFEYIRKRDRLLDLGIGTGLASQPFHRACLRISGIDISQATLAKCRTKRISSDLRLHDLRQPLPFGDRQFDHVIAVGVLHFLEDAGMLVRETSRVVKPDGIFGYTTLCPEDESKDVSLQWIQGFPVYQHSRSLMDSLISMNGFHVLKTTRFLYYSDPSKRVQVASRLCVARCTRS